MFIEVCEENVSLAVVMVSRDNNGRMILLSNDHFPNIPINDPPLMQYSIYYERCKGVDHVDDKHLYNR